MVAKFYIRKPTKIMANSPVFDLDRRQYCAQVVVDIKVKLRVIFTVLSDAETTIEYRYTRVRPLT